MMFNSIRWRLQLWHALLLVIVLAGFGFTAYQVARENQMRRVDAELELHLNALLRPPPPPNGLPGLPPPGRPKGPPPEYGRFDFVDELRKSIAQGPELDQTQTNVFYYFLWQRDGKLLARSPNSPVNVASPVNPDPPRMEPPRGFEGPGHRGRPFVSQTRTRGEAREVYRFGLSGECVLVGRSLAAEQATMYRLALWLGAAGASVLVIGLAGGWWVAGRAIRPIEDISATATKIAGGDLSQRINAADTDSELGRLVTVLNSTFARLEAVFAQQTRFTADASHELRTPITVLLTQTQSALNRERSPAEYREALSACQRAAQRMRSLTESLLELARLDAGQEGMPRAPFDLVGVVRESIELVRPIALGRGVQIEWSGEGSVECVGDGERIGQVVTNLLTNAIEFNREHGTVCVSVGREGDLVLLTVADTGKGIPEEDLPHIFERFYRVDKSRSRHQGHDGLGLAICQAIVERHGGRIEVSSRVGEGTVFRVRLPAKGNTVTQ